jgi:hypothetical protein
VVRRIDRRKNALALTMKISPGTNMEMASAISLLWVSRSTSGVRDRGDFLQERFVWKPARWCSMAAHMLLFSSSSYDARTYVLEEEPIAGHRWIMLYGEGLRLGLAFAAHIPSRSLKIIISWSREEHSRRPGIPNREDSIGLRLFTEW